MKKLLWVTLLSVGLALQTNAQVYSSQTYTNGFQNAGAIPDGSLNGWSDTRTVTGAGVHHVADVQVSLTISNGYAGDLYAYLVHSNGMAVLLNRVGLASTNPFGYADAGLDVTFSSAGANDVHFYQNFAPTYNGNGWLTGTWLPDARAIDPLSAPSAFDAPGTTNFNSFLNQGPNGDWTLFVADVSAGGGQSTVIRWGLQINTVTEPATNLVITSVNGGVAPTAGTPFSVVIQAQDVNGLAANVTADTVVSLSLNSGDGILAGTLTGTMLSGTSSVTISGVTYSKAQSGVALTATRTNGNNLTAGDSSTFAVNPGAFAQLQVLMPGETAAPGSATGKAGTPTAQTVATALNVTVNAVDANWNLITTNDTVHFTSSDGSAVLASDAGLSNGTGTFSLTFFTAGSQTVTASDVTHAGITQNTGSPTTVNAGNQTITFTSPGDQTYGVPPITLTATASSGLAVAYAVTAGPATVSGNILTLTGAGSVTIQASQAGNANWNAATPVSQTITVYQKSLTPNITANDKVYDGNTSATIASRSLTGVINGDAVTLTGGTATFADPTVGIGKTVTASGLSLGGSDASKYVLTSTTATTTASITAATVIIASGISANSKVYDTTTTVTLSSNNVVLTGVLSGDTANVSLSTNNYAAHFADAAVGLGKPVTVSGLSLTGSAAANYTLTQPTGLTADITAAGVTIASGISANSKVYDTITTATLSSNNVVLTGVLSGDTANVSLSTNGYSAHFADAAVGLGKSVTVSGLSLTGSAAANYTLTQPTGLTANITGAGVTIASGISANSKVYDTTSTATLSSNNVVLTGVLSGDAVNVSLSTNSYAAHFADAAVGLGKSVTVSGLSLTGSAAANYTLTQPVGLTADITAAGVTIASGISANSKVYDTTTTATLSSNNVVLTGVLSADTAYVSLSTNSYTAHFADAAVGLGKSVTVSSLSLTGSAAGNYTLTQPVGLTADITAAGVTIASGISANSKVYDTTTTATLSSNNVVLTGVLSADAANVSLSTNNYSAHFADAAVGLGKSVTVSGLSLTGSAAANYTLTQPVGLMADITAAGVTIASGISANSKVYDTTTTATLSSNNVVLTGVLSGDAANVALSTNSYAAHFADAAVGLGKSVTVSLSLTGSAAANYTLTQPVGLTANITAAGVTIASGISANSKVYDTTTTATLNSNNVVLTGVLSGDTANVPFSTNSYSAHFADAAVGLGKSVTVSGLSLTGSAAANYTLTQPVGLTADITAAGVTIASGISANSKVYDTTTAATLSSNNVVLTGVLSGDVANVSLSTNSYSAHFADAAVGLGKSVTVSGLSLTGSAAANYTLTQPVGLTADITAAGVTIASGISANSKVYDTTTAATLSSNNVVLTGVLSGDAANVSLSTNGYSAHFADAAVGLGKSVTVSGLSLTGSAAANYTLTQPVGLTANITAAGVTIASGISANSKVYDTIATATLSSNNVVLAGVLSGDTSNVALSTNGYSAHFADAAVGLGKSVTVSGLSLTGSAAANYTLTQPVGLTANITAAGVMIASGISANSKVYDTTTTATLSSNNVVLTGVLSGDAANVALSTNSYAAHFADAAVGLGKSVTVSGLSLTGSAAGNYTLTQPVGLTADITAAGVTIASGISANSKVYDTTATAILSSNNVVLAGVLSGDTSNVALSTNGYSAHFADAAVGLGKSVTVSGLSLTGSAAANYTLTQPVGLTANITAAGVTIASGISANSKVYDTTTTATLSSNNVVLAGVLSGDAANVSLYTNNYSAHFADAAVGLGKSVTVSGLSLTGSAAGNYTLTQPVGLTADITAGTVTQLAFTTQPSLASAGATFGQQPVVKTQDQYGNDTTVGLGASLTVTVTLSSGTGPLQGTATLNIGTSAGNGTVSFTDLRIDPAGTKQLTASASGLTAALSATFNIANVPPLASTATFLRPRNVPLKILISNLLTNASDLNGDTLQLAGVSAFSTNGAKMYTNATYVLYSLPPGGNVTDSFTYTVSDGTASTSGTVLITMQPDPSGTNCNVVTYVLVNGLPTMTFAGVPGYTYLVQRTQDLATHVWTDLLTTNAPAGGLFQFVDQNPPNGNLFYRAQNQ